MKMNSEDGTNKEEMINKRENCLPTIISSLGTENQNSEILANIKLCFKFLSTFSISEVDTELLQCTIPVIKKCLTKVYENNSLLSDTADDGFVLSIIKENFQIAVEFIQIMKTVLEFILENTEVNLNDICSVPVNSGMILLLTFEHCKNSSETFRKTFSVELLEIFHVAEEMHVLFLNLMESCVVINDTLETAHEFFIIPEVLDIICHISEVLHDMNLKPMSKNWQGFINIIQKLPEILKQKINLQLPIQCLTSKIGKNLSALEELELTTDLKLAVQYIKIASYLVKVALKIYDTFWNCLEAISTELLDFCCVPYSFPPDLYRTLGYPQEILDLVENSIFISLEPFIRHLIDAPSLFNKMVSSENIEYKYPFGLINFLNNYLKCAIENDADSLTALKLDNVLNHIFDCFKLCSFEFYWRTSQNKNIYDNFVIILTATFLTSEELYKKFEFILLENVLQEHTLCALLAIDIWCLYLRNSPQQLSEDTLINILKHSDKLDLGSNTPRLEFIHLKCLNQRIFRFLPLNSKNTVIKIMELNCVNTWKLISFQNFPIQQSSIIENLCTLTVDKIEDIERENYRLKDIVRIIANMDLLSTVNFQDMGLNPRNLVNAVYFMWQFSYSEFDNNIFKYFINKLCKITGTLIMEFNNDELFTILNQLNVLAADDSFKLLVCKVLSALSDKNSNELGQEKNQIFLLISNIFYPTLMTTSDSVIKQNVLEVLETFANKEKPDIVKGVMRMSKDVQGEVSNYLQRTVVDINKFDREYFRLLHHVKFEHKCIRWSTESAKPVIKKIRMDDQAIKYSKENDRLTLPQQREASKKGVDRGRKCAQIEENKTDNIDESVYNIKSEMKRLLNLLKTEKLSKKNISDLRLVSNQLLSLM